MEIIAKGVLWSLILWAYTHFVLNKKMDKEVEGKFQLFFSIVTAYALVIVSRSVVFRVSQIINSSGVINVILNVLFVAVGYNTICLFSMYFMKDVYRKWVKYFVSWIFSAFLVTYFVVGNMNNEVYVIIYAISLVASLVIMKGRGDKIEETKNSVWKTRLKFSLPVSIFAMFTFCVYLPSELYLGNPENFEVIYLKFVWPHLVQFILFVLLYLIITLFFITKNHYYVCNISCAMFALLSHVQNMFLNGKLNSMDGTEQEWSVGTVVGNAAIWIVVILAVFIATYYAQKKVRNVLKIVSYCGIGVQIISLVILLVVTPNEVGNHEYVLSTKAAFEVAPQNNVIVFVLDWFDNQIMDKIIEEDEGFLSPLDGFTYYSNATSRYAFTDMSVVYLLTGEEWKDDLHEKVYGVEANRNSDVLEQIEALDYTLGIYTHKFYVGADRDSLNIENGTYAEKSLDISGQIKLMSKTTRYKVFPFALKNYYFYADEDINSIQRTDVPVHNIHNDIPFATQLLSEGITVDEERKGAFKFYHLHGAHKPYDMTEELIEGDSDMVMQSRASMKIVYKYIEELKKNGLYEDAAIIITADHGQNYFNKPYKAAELGLDMTSAPILFYKEAGNFGTELDISQAPVSHDEIVPTILEVITGDTHGYGRTINEIGEDEQRVREFIYGRHNDIPFVRYEITGDVREVESWSEPVLITE